MFLWGQPMPQPEPKPEPEQQRVERDTEAELVRAWRVAAGMALGYEWADAVRLADSGADMHRVAQLLDYGATPGQAFRILT